jgi:predicted histone-like DNA-binding protein
MSINYKVIEQPASKLSTTGKPTYNARACGRKRMSLDKIAETIQRRSSLSKGDVYSTLISLTDLIPDLLLTNHTVDLGDLGTLSLHLSSKSEERAEDVTWRSVKELKVQFRASKELKKNLKKANFVRVDK